MANPEWDNYKSPMSDGDFVLLIKRGIEASNICDLADLLGVGPMTVEHWEQGNHLACISIREGIAEAIERIL